MASGCNRQYLVFRIYSHQLDVQTLIFGHKCLEACFATIQWDSDPPAHIQFNTRFLATKWRDLASNSHLWRIETILSFIEDHRIQVYAREQAHILINIPVDLLSWHVCSSSFSPIQRGATWAWMERNSKVHVRQRLFYWATIHNKANHAGRGDWCECSRVNSRCVSDWLLSTLHFVQAEAINKFWVIENRTVNIYSLSIFALKCIAVVECEVIKISRDGLYIPSVSVHQMEFCFLVLGVPYKVDVRCAPEQKTLQQTLVNDIIFIQDATWLSEV